MLVGPEVHDVGGLLEADPEVDDAILDEAFDLRRSLRGTILVPIPAGIEGPRHTRRRFPIAARGALRHAVTRRPAPGVPRL